MAAHCGHPPAALVTWRRYAAEDGLGSWVASLRLPQIGEATAPASRLALVLTVEWILESDPHDAWRRVTNSLWGAWRSLPMNTLDQETRTLLKTVPLTSPRDNALWTLATMISQSRTYPAGVEREICRAIETLELSERSLLRHLRGHLALWALNLDSDESWRVARKLNESELTSLLGSQIPS